MLKCLCVTFVLLTAHFGGAQPSSAQQNWLPAPDRDQRLGPNRVGLDIGVLAASLSYARQASSSLEWGVTIAAGAQTGFMLGSSELAGDAAIPLFVELFSAGVFLRGDLATRTELEAGARVGRLYHASEYETLFSGIYSSVSYQIGALHLGPRIDVGRIAEETGRSEFKVAIVPLTVGFRWSW